MIAMATIAMLALHITTTSGAVSKHCEGQFKWRWTQMELFKKTNKEYLAAEPDEKLKLFVNFRNVTLREWEQHYYTPGADLSKPVVWERKKREEFEKIFYGEDITITFKNVDDAFKAFRHWIEDHWIDETPGKKHEVVPNSIEGSRIQIVSPRPFDAEITPGNPMKDNAESECPDLSSEDGIRSVERLEREASNFDPDHEEKLEEVEGVPEGVPGEVPEGSVSNTLADSTTSDNGCTDSSTDERYPKPKPNRESGIPLVNTVASSDSKQQRHSSGNGNGDSTDSEESCNPLSNDKNSTLGDCGNSDDSSENTDEIMASTEKNLRRLKKLFSS